MCVEFHGCSVGYLDLRFTVLQGWEVAQGGVVSVGL